MTEFSDYSESQLLDATLRGGTYTGGAVYFALFTTDPTDAGSGTELTDSGYARQQAHTSVVSDGFAAPADGVTSNAKTITFPAIVDAQVTITHAGIYDALTNGNLLYHSPLASSKTLDPGDVLEFPVGQITVTLS